jgi:tetratricopeptide (TPR) repeat protein
MAFEHQVVAFIGRLETLPLRRARRAVVKAGGRVRRDVGKALDTCIVGHGAASDIERWQPHIDRAKAAGARLLSENAFLQLLGSRPRPTAAGSGHSASDMQAGSGLADEDLDLLMLFDIVEPVDGVFAFRDLILARNIAQLLARGVAIADVIRDLAGRRRCFDRVPASLVEDEAGRIVVGIGPARLELDGQLRLPLEGGACPPIEALWEAAEAAEDRGDLEEAETFYRRCLDRDRSDHMAAFNLANVLLGLNREREARRWLEHAVACRPPFADAWYNLGVIAARSGRQDLAAHYYERALDGDPAFLDALYNLAAIRFGEGRLRDAAALWSRYLERETDGKWARRARHGVALCRGLGNQFGRREKLAEDPLTEQVPE